ncbi:MAG: DUF1989 domain-containing protein [Dehalococcoidia bacterium]
MSDSIDKRDITGYIIQEVTIPAREYLALTIRKGQRLRLIDLEGQQVIDVIFFNLNDSEERSSCVVTTLFNKTLHITKGHHIFSQKGRRMFEIVEDTVGTRGPTGGFTGGYCNDDINYARFGIRGARNCRDNFAMALAPYGLTGKDFSEDCCASLFMNLCEDDNGVWEIREPINKPGDYMELLAETDCLVAISNCPQDRSPCNGFNPTPIKVIVYES